MKGGFFKNALTLSGGVAFAQALPLLFYPVLSRIYTPGEFGLLAVVTSIVSVLAVAGSGKYESAILVARDREEAARLAVLSVGLGLLTMAVVALLLPFSRPLAALMGEPMLAGWLWVCPLSAFCLIVFNVYNEWCVRGKMWGALSVNKIVNAGAITLAKVALGFVRLCSQGLVVGDLVGRAVSAAGCIVRAWHGDGALFRQVRWRGLVRCAKEYREFPLYTMPGRLLNTLGQSMPPILLTAYFGSEAAGSFSMAMLVFVLPITVIGNSLGDVYRQRAAEEMAATGNCRKSYDRMLRTTLLAGVAALAAVVWFLPWLMGFVLGAEWVVAGRYAQILAPMMVLSFVANPLSCLFIVADRLRAFFWWQVMYAAAASLSLWAGHALWGSIGPTLTLYACAMGVTYVVSILMTRRFSNKGT